MSPEPRQQGKTPHHAVRAPDDLWKMFGANVERAGEKDRSDVLRQFMRWYNRESGAKMPRRPDAADHD